MKNMSSIIHGFIAIAASFPICMEAQQLQSMRLGEGYMTVSGNAAYWIQKPALGTIPSRIFIVRWKAGIRDTASVMPTTATDVFAPIGIGSSFDGDLLVAFAQHTKSTAIPPACGILKYDFESDRHKIVWTSSTLTPIKVALSPNGHLYIIGVTAEERRLIDRQSSATVVHLLHIYNATNDKVASLLPVHVSNYGTIMGLMQGTVISVRANGNFIVGFDQTAVILSGYESLIAKEVREYSPNGMVVQIHEFRDLPQNAVINSAIFDSEDNLITHIAHVLGSPVNTPLGSAIKWGEGYVVKRLANSLTQRFLFKMVAPESIVGIMGDKTIVTIHKGRGRGESMLMFRAQ